MGSIGSIYINKGEYIGFREHGYNQVDEEPNDDNYNDVDNDNGEENGNKGGRNSDSINCREGGTSGSMVGGNNDAASISNGNGGPRNAFLEDPT